MEIFCKKLKKYLCKRLYALEPNYRHFAFYSIGILMLVSLVMGVSFKNGTDFSIKADYRESANIFVLMDQVSGWKKGFCKVAYKNYWKEKYPETKEDLAYFQRYKKLREKYFIHLNRDKTDVSKSEEGFFASEKILREDPLGAVFYSSETLQEALNNLSSLLTSEEIKFLRRFYQHFEKQYAPLVAESKGLKNLASDFSVALQDQKLITYLKKVAYFYRSSLGKSYTALYVWAPLGKEGFAFPAGDFLIIQCHPTLSADKIPGREVVIHEVIHTISARQPLEQKKTLTKIFLEIFKNTERMDYYKILEEPLAVVWGQALYLKLFNQKFYQTQRYGLSWYNDSWINIYAQLLIPLIEEAYQSGAVMDEALVKQMARMGYGLSLLSKPLS